MPIGPIPPGCIAVCAPPAEDATRAIPIHSGVVQFSSDGVVLSDVMVTGCTVAHVFFTEITSRAVGLTVGVAVDFSFVGTVDGFTFSGTSTVEGDIFFDVVLLPTHESFASPLDCAAEFTCAARYAGVDPTTGLQQFIVHLTGSVTCVGCPQVPYIIVQACPTP